MPAEPTYAFDVGGGQNLVNGPDIASASTIAPQFLCTRITGTAAIDTITLPYAGFAGPIYLIPNAAFTTTTGGNISLASTAVANKVLVMVYTPTTGKWNPSY